MPSGTVTPAGGGLPNPVVTALNVTPPSGAVGVSVTPVSPNATGANTTALTITVPQSTAPNFPNIYALVVTDPNTADVPFFVGSDGATVIHAQPFGRPLSVIAATTDPDLILAQFSDHLGNAVVQMYEAGGVSIPRLPTADPHVAGALWNSATTLKVSAG